MNLSVQGCTRSAEELQPLVDFVRPYTSCSDKAHIMVKRRSAAGRFGRGRAHAAVPLSHGSTPLVQIWLSHGLFYPAQSGGTMVRSWQEEFVFLLAHELRHLDQFANGVYRTHQVEVAEKDAEAFADTVLGHWRRVRA
jgi:hypothetical protein